MDLRLACVTLTVHDLGAALAFYRDVLGFEVREDVRFGDARWVAVGPPAQPGVRIALAPPGLGRATAADRRAVEGLLADGLLSGPAFRTDDCDAAFEHVEAAGVEVVQEPVDRPSGVRDCAFFDPSGTILRFAGTSKTGST
ncbi:MAG: VOC family protein [Saccharothrix sp.]|nr:VOC family protein [Saccharothrix sp.]